MPNANPAADTDAWRALLPWMADDELRELLDERGAWMLSERLRGTGLPVGLEGAPLDLVAEVLAEVHGDPVRLLDGEPLPSRCYRRCVCVLPGRRLRARFGPS